MTILEQAKSLMAFKANVVRECKKNGLEVPSDEIIENYIKAGHTLKASEFIEYYTKAFSGEKRSPVSKEVLAFVIDNLEEGAMCALFNHYQLNRDKVHIYDLDNEQESMELQLNLEREELFEICQLVNTKNARFIILTEDENGMTGVQDIPTNSIPKMMENIWDDMFEDIIMTPSSYVDVCSVLVDILLHVMAEASGYKLDYKNAKVTYEGK